MIEIAVSIMFLIVIVLLVEVMWNRRDLVKLYDRDKREWQSERDELLKQWQKERKELYDRIHATDYREYKHAEIAQLKVEKKAERESTLEEV